MNTMKNYFICFIASLVAISIMNCDDASIAFPGNYKANEPSNPVGKLTWVITHDNDIGQLPENLQGTNTILGFIDVDDKNPDDEIETVTIQSQKVNGNVRELFTVIEDSVGDWKIVLRPSANIDYESVHSQNGSSTLAELVMEITDDSPSKSKGALTASVLITNVNESPTWVNTYIITELDEGIHYESSAITWSDVDLDDNHTLGSDNLPGWLAINVNKLVGNPLNEHVNPSISFTLKLTDAGGLQITNPYTINVRANGAPGFSGSYEQTWEEEINKSWSISFTDPNSVDYSTMSAEVPTDLSSFGLDFLQNGMSGIISGTLPHSYANQQVTFQINLNDNRNGNPITTTETFTINVDPNDVPFFTNADNIIQSIHHGCQYYYDIDWNDPDGDIVTFDWSEDIAWLNVNSLGQLSGTPAEGDIGSSGSVSLLITDNRPNVPLSAEYSFTISVDENIAPEFTNEENVLTTATVGSEYSFQFAIDDDNNDNIEFSVPVRPNWLNYSVADYKIYGTPQSSDTTGNNVTVRASDCGEETSYSFFIEVTN